MQPSSSRRSSSPRARRSGGRSSSASGSTSASGSADARSWSRGMPAAVARRERAAQGPRRAVQVDAERGRDRLRHDRRRSTVGSTASPPTSGRPARRSGALAGRTQQVISGLAVLLDGRGAHRGRAHRGHLPRARASARSTGTWAAASGASAPAATRSRAPARRSCDRSHGEVENVVGLPLAASAGAVPRAAAPLSSGLPSQRPLAAANTLRSPVGSRRAFARLRRRCTPR